MESILRGIVSSTQHPDSLKNLLLQKYFSTMNHHDIQSSECVGLLKLYMEWILTSEKPELRKHGHEQLVLLAKARN